MQHLEDAVSTDTVIDSVIFNYLSPEDFDGLEARDASLVAKIMLRKIAHFEAMANAKYSPSSPELIAQNKATWTKAAKWVCRDLRDGMLARKDIGLTMESHAWRLCQREKVKPAPKFEKYAHITCTYVERALSSDAAVQRIAIIIKQVPNLQTFEDIRSVSALCHDLGKLAGRATLLEKKLQNKLNKVMTDRDRHLLGMETTPAPDGLVDDKDV